MFENEWWNAIIGISMHFNKHVLRCRYFFYLKNVYVSLPRPGSFFRTVTFLQKNNCSEKAPRSGERNGYNDHYKGVQLSKMGTMSHVKYKPWVPGKPCTSHKNVELWKIYEMHCPGRKFRLIPNLRWIENKPTKRNTYRYYLYIIVLKLTLLNISTAATIKTRLHYDIFSKTVELQYHLNS